MIVNLGCGDRPLKKTGGKPVVNVDMRKTEITDVVHDLSVTPWPFANQQFDEAYAIDIIEHMVHVPPFMDEAWRILKVGGKLRIRTTYFMSEQSYRDPTHHHYFTLESFDYWDPETEMGCQYPYWKRRWKVLHRAIDGNETVFELEKLPAT